ncbi:MAG TPA: hypothetical protein DDY12_04995 [Porphyromonadaceae bacterium]|nr:hypothetical protein [Porphyromonadaceae bacterium]
MSHSAMMPRGNKIITPLKRPTLLNHVKLDIIKIAKTSSMGVKCHQKNAGWDYDCPLYALKSLTQ